MTSFDSCFPDNQVLVVLPGCFVGSYARRMLNLFSGTDKELVVLIGIRWTSREIVLHVEKLSILTLIKNFVLLALRNLFLSSLVLGS